MNTREYPCRMIRVINGNTIKADIDLGFGLSITQDIRLYGIEKTPESMAALIKLVPKEFVCQTIYNKKAKASRVLGIVYKQDDDGGLHNINEMLIEQGLAAKYPT